jgi:hypothetical protein
MKVYLSSFASSDLSRSAKRFKKQAEKMKIYDEILIFNENNLDKDFGEYVKSLIKNGKYKGYGYWVWQSYFHRLVFSNMQQDDIYHWCDIGCHFNINGVNRLKEYIKIVTNSESGLLGFDYSKPKLLSNFDNFTFPEYFENQYTKGDLIKYFNLNCEDKIIQSPQIWGGSFFLRKSETSKKILNEHYNLSRNRFDLIDDDINKFKEKSCTGYIQHRHPQSVLSILFKIYECDLISAYESEWALDQNGKRTFDHLKNYPIIAKRDKKKNIFLRFFDRQKKNFLRRKNKYFGL